MKLDCLCVDATVHDALFVVRRSPAAPSCRHNNSPRRSDPGARAVLDCSKAGPTGELSRAPSICWLHSSIALDIWSPRTIAMTSHARYENADEEPSTGRTIDRSLYWLQKTV